MPARLDIFGAISGSVALAIQIHDFFQNQLKDSETDDLIISIKHDSTILHDFARIFDLAVKDNTTSQADKLLLNEVCVALQPTLISVQGWIIRRQTAYLTASPARRVTDMVVGFLYKQAELQKIATELFQWTERYHIRLGLLPPTLKEKLLADADKNTSLKSSSLRALRETFARLTMQSQHVQDAGLVRDEQEVALCPGARSPRMVATLDKDPIIVEFKGYKTTLAGKEFYEFEQEVVKLMKLLNCADTQLCRILRGNGYFHEPSHYCFAFLYQLPRNVYVEPNASSPITLLDLINAKRRSERNSKKFEPLPPLHPLEHRFEFARKIACAVMYVHIMNYVHKSIRTSNIVVLAKKAPPQTGIVTFPKHLGEPFLCGFETARHDKATSDQSGDTHWRYNIYRHPKRQGLHPQERYTMNHDIYSLGVVLLELGLWEPLLTTGLAKLQEASSEDIAAGMVRDYLKTLAADKLTILMGTKYCETVLFCLNVDGDSQVGNSTVIEEVLRKLEELSVGMH